MPWKGSTVTFTPLLDLLLQGLHQPTESKAPGESILQIEQNGYFDSQLKKNITPPCNKPTETKPMEDPPLH